MTMWLNTTTQVDVTLDESDILWLVRKNHQLGRQLSRIAAEQMEFGYAGKMTVAFSFDGKQDDAKSSGSEEHVHCARDDDGNCVECERNLEECQKYWEEMRGETDDGVTDNWNLPTSDSAVQDVNAGAFDQSYDSWHYPEAVNGRGDRLPSAQSAHDGWDSIAWDEPRGSASSAWDTPAVVTGWNASESTLNTGVVDWGHTTAEGGDGGDNCDAKKEEVAWYERRIETDFEEMDKLCTCYTEGCEGCDLGHHYVDCLKKFRKPAAKLEASYEWDHDVVAAFHTETDSRSDVFGSWQPEMEEDSDHTWDTTEDTFAIHEYKISKLETELAAAKKDKQAAIDEAFSGTKARDNAWGLSGQDDEAATSIAW